MNSLLTRYYNTAITSCVALLCSLLLVQGASAQSYTYKNTNSMMLALQNGTPTYDLGGSTIFADNITFINYFPTDGTFNISTSILCTSDGNSYNGKKYAGSINYIDTPLTGSGYVYVNSNCVTFFSQSNSYSGGTCIDGATLHIVAGQDSTGASTAGTLGSTNGKTYLMNNAMLDLGGTTQTQQSFNYTPFDPNTATNGSLIMNGTIVDATGKSTTFDANGNDVSTPSSGPSAPAMPGSGN